MIVLLVPSWIGCGRDATPAFGFFLGFKSRSFNDRLAFAGELVFVLLDVFVFMAVVLLLFFCLTTWLTRRNSSRGSELTHREDWFT